MRKIDDWTAAQVYAEIGSCRRSERSMGNTVVDGSETDCGRHVVYVRLHGNLIFVMTLPPQYVAEKRRVYVSLAGWDTPTTRRRLNALLAEFTRWSVARRGGRTLLVSGDDAVPIEGDAAYCLVDDAGRTATRTDGKMEEVLWEALH